MNLKAKNILGRTAWVSLTVLVMMAMTTMAVFAGNVHFNRPPTFTSNGLTLTASGTIYGLGSGDVLITLQASGSASLLCTNPGGSSKVPGQNPNFSASGSGSVPANKVKNGHVSFTVTTEPPASPVPGAPDCPNSSWTETITSVVWTSARIIVEQPVGTVVLDQTFPIP